MQTLLRLDEIIEKSIETISVKPSLRHGALTRDIYRLLVQTHDRREESTSRNKQDGRAQCSDQ